MSDGPEFFQTRMGKTYYEHTMPAIAKALEGIAGHLAKLKSPADDTNGVMIEQLRHWADELEADEPGAVRGDCA